MCQMCSKKCSTANLFVLELAKNPTVFRKTLRLALPKYELINTTEIVVVLVIVQNFGSRAASLCTRILLAHADTTFCVLFQL